jgi:hypothetical protein
MSLQGLLKRTLLQVPNLDGLVIAGCNGMPAVRCHCNSIYRRIMPPQGGKFLLLVHSPELQGGISRCGKRMFAILCYTYTIHTTGMAPEESGSLPIVQVP